MRAIGLHLYRKIFAARRSRRPRFFLCSGQYGSGSTWMFNLVREICRNQSVDFISGYRDSEIDLPFDAAGSRLMVVKSHVPAAGLQSFIASSGEPAIITVRDPRDAVVSSMQRFPDSWATNFEKTLDSVERSAQSLFAFAQVCEIPVFRFEDGFIGSVETFKCIAALLGTSPSRNQRDAILGGLTPEAVRRTISDLEAAGVIRGEEKWDGKTHWHANHLNDGQIGKFKSVLSPSQQGEIGKRTREYCEYFGYRIDDN